MWTSCISPIIKTIQSAMLLHPYHLLKFLPTFLLHFNLILHSYLLFFDTKEPFWWLPQFFFVFWYCDEIIWLKTFPFSRNSSIFIIPTIHSLKNTIFLAKLRAKRYNSKCYEILFENPVKERKLLKFSSRFCTKIE